MDGNEQFGRINSHHSLCLKPSLIIQTMSKRGRKKSISLNSKETNQKRNGKKHGCFSNYNTTLSKPMAGVIF